jgi:hypothetical protein
MKFIKNKLEKKLPNSEVFFYCTESFSILSFCLQMLKIFQNKLATVIGPTHPGTGLIA